MLFIFSLIIASIFALTAKSTIKRHPYPWYIGALVLTLFISLFPFSRNLPEAVTFLLDLFRRGALSCALWCIVMWTVFTQQFSLDMQSVEYANGIS